MGGLYSMRLHISLEEPAMVLAQSHCQNDATGSWDVGDHDTDTDYSVAKLLTRRKKKTTFHVIRYAWMEVIMSHEGFSFWFVTFQLISEFDWESLTDNMPCLFSTLKRDSNCTHSQYVSSLCCEALGGKQESTPNKGRDRNQKIFLKINLWKKIYSCFWFIILVLGVFEKKENHET